MKITLPLLLLLFASACGYQLRQTAALPAALQTIYLQLPVGDPLYRPLFRALSNQGVTLSKQPQPTTATLSIEENSLQRFTQSIGTNNRVQEYRLNYQLQFSLTHNDQTLVNRQQINIERNFSFDADQIAGMQSEETVIREQMYQDMAQRIVRHLSHLKI